MTLQQPDFFPFLIGAADAGAFAEVTYWKTKEGILDRFSMLAEDVQLSTFNGAVKILGNAYGVTDWTISGELKNTSCEWCIGHVGVSYHKGRFMPSLPKHPYCDHFYDITRVGEKPVGATNKKQK